MTLARSHRATTRLGFGEASRRLGDAYNVQSRIKKIKDKISPAEGFEGKATAVPQGVTDKQGVADRNTRKMDIMKKAHSESQR